jgi:hypothetical protein
MTTLLGCDFSSSPTKRKPIVVAAGSEHQGGVQLHHLHRFDSLPAWTAWLGQQPDFVGAFDFPFGLPRELVAQLGWPTTWLACMQHYTSMTRADIRACFQAFCAARPVGKKFAHRATDAPAGSSPSMKWVNPPVAYMMHAGVPCLLQVGVHVPRLHDGDRRRVALEGYPGLWAQQVLGRRSYKSDDKHKQTSDRAAARAQLIHALVGGEHRWGVRVHLSDTQREALQADATGDHVDAVVCMLQGAWALQQHRAGDAHFGLPACDALEGWIVSS